MRLKSQIVSLRLNLSLFHNSCFLVLVCLNNLFFRKQRGEKAKQEAKVKKMNGFLDSNMKKRMQLLENYNRLVCSDEFYHLPASHCICCFNNLLTV